MKSGGNVRWYWWCHGELDPETVRNEFLQAVSDGLISKWAVPDRIEVVDAIPKTSVGKIDKKHLRTQFR